MADYEEQTIITGVKSGQHCTICQVRSTDRENLCPSTPWPKRTHESTKHQHKRQHDDNTDPTDEAWVHPVESFAWRHHLVNIHTSMTVDILHQLMKGIIKSLVIWIRRLLKDVVPTERHLLDGSQRVTKVTAEVQLDRRFRQVPPHTGLKRFLAFSKVQQWTGNEEKAMVRQLLPVIAPLLQRHSPDALHCARAILDFVTIAQYRAHDDSTLQYLEQALYRIDKTKGVFRAYRTKQSDTNEGHFNYPKFHVMAHYSEFVREFGCADGYDTSHSEAAHKYLIKVFFDRTNKRGDMFQQQLISHNIRRLNALATEDLFTYLLTKATTAATQQMDVQTTTPCRELNLSMLGWPSTPHDRLKIRTLGLRVQRWRAASVIANCTEIPDFIDSLAVFVREQRNKRDGIHTSSGLLERRDRDPTWISEYYLAVHGALVCWKRAGADPDDMERRMKEYVRCSPNWQGNAGKWRRDHVWLQEYTDSHGDISAKRVGQLQLIVTILDPTRRDAKGKLATYTGALVKLLRPVDGGRPHRVHGMVEVKQWPVGNARRPRDLGAYRVYELSTISRSAHVIPAGGMGHDAFFVNNWIDWDQYNTLYDEDFLARGIRTANDIERRVEGHRGARRR